MLKSISLGLPLPRSSSRGLTGMPGAGWAIHDSESRTGKTVGETSHWLTGSHAKLSIVESTVMIGRFPNSSDSPSFSWQPGRSLDVTEVT